MAAWECSEEEHTALLQGQDCPYYADKAKAKITETSVDCGDCLARQAAGENIACPGCVASAALVLAGGDKDEHGCKPSVGEAWCPRKEKCVLPSEKCPGGTLQCQSICADLKAGKEIGYKTSCECKPLALEGEKCCNTDVTPSECEFEGCDEGLVCHTGEASWIPGVCKKSLVSEPQVFSCSCPPSMAAWECSEEEHTALLQGQDCPYYADKAKAQQPVVV